MNEHTTRESNLSEHNISEQNISEHNTSESNMCEHNASESKMSDNNISYTSNKMTDLKTRFVYQLKMKKKRIKCVILQLPITSIKGGL